MLLGANTNHTDKLVTMTDLIVLEWVSHAVCYKHGKVHTGVSVEIYANMV